MNTSQAILIAETRFGAWVEGEQLYFPSVYLRQQWEQLIARHDAQIAGEQHFEFNGKRWCGAAIGWRKLA